MKFWLLASIAALAAACNTSDPALCGNGAIDQGELCDPQSSTFPCAAEATCDTCPTGTAQCGSWCIDILSDRDNCGACGTACGNGEVCNGAGTCELSCQDGLLDCDGTCIDPMTNRDHCGASADCGGNNAGVACADGEICNGAGSCELSCQDSLLACGGTCIDPMTNRTFCGASGDCLGGNVGTACDNGEICDGSGQCALTCQDSLVACGGTCIDPTTSLDYCGASGDCMGDNAGEVCDPSGTCTVDGCVLPCTPGSAGFTFSGIIESFTLPPGCTDFFIEAAGAQGGSYSTSGGPGAYMSGTFSLSPGSTLFILVGENPFFAVGGGGGTFVVDGSGNPVLVAGGGGGGADDCCGSQLDGMPGVTGPDGTAGIDAGCPPGMGGSNGNGGEVGDTDPNNGAAGSAGGGFYTNGADGIDLESVDPMLTNPGGGVAYTSGGNGGSGDYLGGFGGGGGTAVAGGNWPGGGPGGGGGGYSGGGGGCSYDDFAGGGGGGSFNAGNNQNNADGANVGHGWVTIYWGAP